MAESKRTDEIQGEIVHVYDGIEEADNQLPRWWLATFFLTIVFGIGYWFAYHEYQLAPLPVEEYADAHAAQESSVVEVSEEELAALVASPEAVDAGREIFTTTCVACHGARAQGDIGPNLTDHHWIHGGSSVEIHSTIRDGVLTAGMPAWGPSLGPTAVQHVAAFVLSIRDTEVEGKAPEGELYTPARSDTEEPMAPDAQTPEPSAPDAQTPEQPTPEPAIPGPETPSP